jgi:hypothetical protein
MSKKTPSGSNELRSAFKALQVNAPLRLPKAGPGMKPPTEGPQYEVGRNEPHQSEGPQSRATQVEAAQVEPPRNETFSFSKEAVLPLPLRSTGEVTREQAAQNEVSQNKLSKSEEAQIEHAKMEGSQKDRTSPPQNEAAQIGYVETPDALFESRVNQGFFKLSHAVFSEPLLQELSGDCFRLFLWLSSRAWRFHKSNGQLRASVRFIEAQTRMSHATVSRALKTLKDKNLLRLVETDFKRGNIWQVSGIALGNRGPDDSPPQNEHPQFEGTQNYQASPSNREGSYRKSGTKVPRNEGNIRSIKNQKDLKKDPLILALTDKSENVSDFDREFQEDALHRFETELGDPLRNELIQRFVEKEFPHGFLPPARIVRKMAAMEWCKSIRNGSTMSVAV